MLPHGDRYPIRTARRDSMYWLNVFLFCFFALCGVFVAMLVCLGIFRFSIFLTEIISDVIRDRRDNK